MQRTKAGVAMAAGALAMAVGASVVLAVAGFQAPVAVPAAVPTESLRAIALVADSAGNLVMVEGGRIRKLTPAGELRNVAGNGRQGYVGDGGPAVDAGFDHPDDVAIDAKGNIYVADNLGHRVRVIAPDGKIRTVAGTGEPGYNGDGGQAAATKLQSPVRIVVDAKGDLYIADSGNGRVRKVNAAGVISTVAGNGREGYTGDNGPGNSASIGQVSGLAIDGVGNLYIADSDNARIRKVAAATGVITTVAGNGAEAFAGDGGPAVRAPIQPFNLAGDSAGNLFVVEVNRIRKIGTDGVIRTIAGNGTPGFAGDGGPAAAAQLRGPSAVAADTKGNVFIADALNGRIRKVGADGKVSTIAGSAPPPVAQITNLQTRGNANVGNRTVIQNQLLPPPAPTIAPSGRPVLLDTRLSMIPHPPLTTVKECGHVSKTPAPAVVSCVEESLKAKSPFVASFEQKGNESQVIGLGGTAPDSVVQVTFEGPAGATTGARVSAPRDCATPQFTVTAGAVQIVCK